MTLQLCYSAKRFGSASTPAMKAPAISPSRESLNLRVTTSIRNLIDRAAQSAGKTRTDFVLEAACRAAQDVLLEQTVFMVDSATYAAFQARLDAPAKQNEALAKTMRAKAPWSTNK
jgi:uncharacterized protein (DUF1778 family)